MTVVGSLPARATNRTLSTAAERWAGVGPYYAMFPVDFASKVIDKFSIPGDGVLDPFAGRATSVFAAAATGRQGIGIEINPVGWVYGSVKIRPAPEGLVLARLRQLVHDATDNDAWKADVASLPDFFVHCYHPRVRRFLVAARETLRWKSNSVDRTLMAFLLIYLHGKRSASLSNQMRDGKAFAPAYAVRWWKARQLRPPALDIEGFFKQRIEWRYRKGVIQSSRSEVLLGDATVLLDAVRGAIQRGTRQRFSLLFTSPPYYSITNYHYDQWLRLWMLGGEATPTAHTDRSRKRFDSKDHYEDLITTVFSESAQLMKRGGTCYVRTDARQFTLDTTHAAIAKSFPRRKVRTILRPVVRRTQTALFGDTGLKPGEVDIIVT